MKLLIYRQAPSVQTDNLLHAIEQAVFDVETQRLQDLDVLRKKLLVDRASIAAIILVIADREQFDAVLNMKDLLLDTKVILILDILDGHCLVNAHQLHPRYIADMNSSGEDLAAILTRLLQHVPAGASQ